MKISYFYEKVVEAATGFMPERYRQCFFCAKCNGMSIFNIFRKSKKESKFHPESKWIVSVNNGIMYLTDPNGNELEIAISEVDKVIIETNDQGPFYPGVWWKIISKEKMLTFPQGAIGEDELLNKFQNLPDFDNEKVIEAMSCTTNNEFTCWTKN